MNVHADLRKFECKFCKEMFKQYSTLFNHVKLKHKNADAVTVTGDEKEEIKESVAQINPSNSLITETSAFILTGSKTQSESNKAKNNKKFKLRSSKK
jgi:hypothetical protein